MSRLFAILLLAFFLFPLVGHMVFFKVRRGQLRHELKEKLEHSVPRGALTFIKIHRDWLTQPPAHFQWTEKNEFRLDGKMYDIVYRESSGDTIRLHCLADEAETLLFTHLDHWVETQNSKDPFQRGQSLQWERLLDSLFQMASFFPAPFTSPGGVLDLPPYRFNYLGWEREAVKPPPKVYQG